MKKINKVITTTTTVLAMTAIGASKVSADNVTPSENQSSVQKSSSITSYDVSNAQQKANSAKATVTSAQNSVANVQKSVETDKQMVSGISSKVPEIQKSIKNQKSTINKDQTTITHDKQNINSQQSKVNTDKQSVSSAQLNVADKQSAVSSAQSKVNKDQQRIDDIHNAQAIASSVQSKVNADKQDVANKQSVKDNAQQAVDQASSAKVQADQKVENANKSLTDAKNKQSQDQAKLNGTQKELDDVTDKINSINSITLPNGYTEKALENLPNAGIGSSLFNEGMNNPANVYHPSKNDNYQVDPAHLTSNQQKDLSIWVASIINPIRQQLGYKPLIVNQSTMDFANAIGQEYVKDNWDQQQQGHDVPAIERAAAKFGLDSTDGNLYEDADAVSNSIETMNDLKTQVYFDLKQFLFYDVLHAESVIGDYYGNQSAPSYFGISTDGTGTLHFVQVHGKGDWTVSNIQDPSKFNVNNNYAVPSTDINQLRQQQSLLQSQVNDEKNTVNTDKQAVSNVQNALNDAKNAQSQANNDLVNKQAALSKADNALQQSQSQLSKDETVLTQAQEDIANAPAELKVANDQLAKDNQSLTNAENALLDAQSKLANAKNIQTQDGNKLNNLKTQLKRDEQQLAKDRLTLTQLQKQLADYQNAPEKLKQDELRLAKAQENLEVAEEVEKQAELHLTTLQNRYNNQRQNVLNDKEIVQKTQNSLNNLLNLDGNQTAITKAQATLNQAKTNLMHDQRLLNQRQRNELKTEINANLSTCYVSNLKATTVTKKNNNKQNNKMPQAGESSSVVSLIGVVLLSILSFFGLTFRKKNN